MWITKDDYNGEGPSIVHRSGLHNVKAARERTANDPTTQSSSTRHDYEVREAQKLAEQKEEEEKCALFQARAAMRSAQGADEVIATQSLSGPNHAIVHCGLWLKEEDEDSQALSVDTPILNDLLRPAAAAAAAAQVVAPLSMNLKTVMTGDPFKCETCGAVMDSGAAACSVKVNEYDQDVLDWCCDFCGKLNLIEADIEELPSSQSKSCESTVDLIGEDLDFLEVPATTVNTAAGANSSGGSFQDYVVFVLDCSGSMGVTSEVRGKNPFEDDGPTPAVAHGLTLQQGENLNQQRLPGEARNVSHVSRLACARAALKQQLQALTSVRSRTTRLGHDSINSDDAAAASSETIEVSENWAVSADLICFSNSVRLVGDGTSPEALIEGDRLNNEQSIRDIAQQFAKNTQQQGVGNGGTAADNNSITKVSSINRQSDLKSLEASLKQMEEGGATALGPGLVSAMELLKTRCGMSGGRIVLLTDGLANVGLGNLEDDEEGEESRSGEEQVGSSSISAAARFYEKIGKEACTNGITINVVAIEGGREGGSKVGLEHLGRLSDSTGGTVELVDALKLMDTKLGSASQVKSDRILATRGRLTILVTKAEPPSQAPRAINDGSAIQLSSPSQLDGDQVKSDSNEVASSLSSSKNEQSNQQSFNDVSFIKITRELGNINASTDVSFDYDLFSASEYSTGKLKDHVSIQLQLQYTLRNGEQHLRVKTVKQPISTDRSLAEAAVDAHVLGVAAVQRAAKLAEQSQYEAARVNLISNMRLLQRSMLTVTHQEAYLDFVVASERLDQFMRQKMQEESVLLLDDSTRRQKSSAERVSSEESNEKGSISSNSSGGGDESDEGESITRNDLLNALPKMEQQRNKVVLAHSNKLSSKLLEGVDDDSSSAIFQMKRLTLTDFRSTRSVVAK